MRISSYGLQGKSCRCAAALVAAAILAGCSDDPGLQERLNRLQAEMQEKDRQLQEAQSNLEKAKSELKSARAAKPAVADTPAAAMPQILPKAQVEESYAAASKAMQRRVGSELRNYSVENCTQYPVEMPSDEFPYHSKIALAIRSDGGRSYRLEFPVSADASGKWMFPTSADVASALADGRPSDQNVGTANNPRVAQNNATPASGVRPSMQTIPQMMPGQEATETRVIDWGGGRSSNNARPTLTPATTNINTPPTREAQQPTPQQSRAPSQTMQSDKDVTIHW